MIIGIIGAMDVEIALIREKMKVEETEEYFGTTYYKGNVGGTPVVLVRCGIGKINAAVCANTLIRDYGVTHLINVGIAGSLSETLSVLDTVISDEVVFHDIDIAFYLDIYPEVSHFKADDRLIALCEKAIAMQPDIVYHVGRVATGDEFVENNLLKEDIKSRLSPLCVEMEGAAIAHVAYGNHIPFVILRTISDEANDEAMGTYDDFFDVAAHRSAQIILDLLELLPRQLEVANEF